MPRASGGIDFNAVQRLADTLNATGPGMGARYAHDGCSNFRSNFAESPCTFIGECE